MWTFRPSTVKLAGWMTSSGSLSMVSDLAGDLSKWKTVILKAASKMATDSWIPRQGKSRWWGWGTRACMSDLKGAKATQLQFLVSHGNMRLNVTYLSLKKSYKCRFKREIMTFPNWSSIQVLFCFFRQKTVHICGAYLIHRLSVHVNTFSLDYREDALKVCGFMTVWISKGKRLKGWFGLVRKISELWNSGHGFVIWISLV